jgi:DNA-binding response OmpR family regulator
MLPSIDGFTIIQKLRSKNINSPIIVLTAKSAIKDKVIGLDYGADDYITKPFSFEELIARIRAMLRRKLDEKETVLTCEDLTLDLISREVYRNNIRIELTTKEFAILEYFLRNKGRILTKSQIAEHVWNYEFVYQSNIIEVYIRYLRKKIDDNFEKKLINTVRGVGYKLQ